MKIYVPGTFDLLHQGHINLFKFAKKIGNEVIVALNIDAFVLQFKKTLPTMTYGERRLALEACKYVDRVVPNMGGYDSKECILTVKPDVILHGDDWTGESYYKQMGFTQEWLDAHGITMIYIPYTKGISSRGIKERIKK